MLIQVTQEDIDRGRRRECYNCPIAIAVRRATKHKRFEVDVNTDTVHIHNIGLPLPEKAKAFIALFDLGQPVRPFSFDLEVAHAN